MSESHVPVKVKIRVWGKAAGRCEYEGCNERLWLDTLTQAQFNAAYLAHIIADKPDGPRGDSVLSLELAHEESNLMLMCDKHHRLIDIADVAGHSVERLRAMKNQHEARIELLADIGPDKQSHVLLYGANIGLQGSPLSFKEASAAIVPDRYPAAPTAVELGLKNSSLEDRSPLFWRAEELHLRNMVTQQLSPRFKAGDIPHLSVFALAPQPLLILLGTLLSDIPFAEVYQRRKEPQSWRWEDEPATFEYTTAPEPVHRGGDAALVFALSATVTDARVESVLGQGVPIWRVGIPLPHNDFVRSRAQTQAFRTQVRKLLDRIKSVHGEGAKIHVFPAMPVSLAVDFGRVINAKADLPLIVYDQNKQLGGFSRALAIDGGALLRESAAARSISDD